MFTPNEIWKDIPGYEGFYQVSNLGNVKSEKRKTTKGGVLKNCFSTGYYIINLSKNNIQKRIFIHKLVALAFLPNPENKLQVNHIDGNKLNNNLENLEWCTVSENALHAYKMGLSGKNNPFNIRNPSKGKFGKDSITSKVLYQYSLDGKLINKWHGIREASRNLGIKPQSISNNCNCRTKTTGGFIFKF